MDTTEAHIKMSEKAVEIQALDRQEDGSWYFSKHEEFGGIYCLGSFNEEQLSTSEADAIWLPRQDQLQEMLLSQRYEEKYDLCSAFAAFLWNKPDVMSFEQLWLAFVMKEKYGKVWDGEDWVIKK